MSYSTCYNCNEMTSAYQKYCPLCETVYLQDETFWKDAKESQFPTTKSIKLAQICLDEQELLAKKLKKELK